MHLNDLIEALENLKPYPGKVQLRVGLCIDPEKMIKNHIAILKTNSGNKVFQPYYDRLLELHNLLKK